MNKLLTAFLASLSLIVSNPIEAQTICLGTDINICTGSPLQIDDCASFGGGSNASTSPYVEGQIPYNPDSFTAGTAVNLSDDDVSGVLPIGFSFCYFGNTYTQFYIGSNGWISFSAGQPNTFTSGPIPNTAANVPKNCIMGPWQDWHPGTGTNVGNYIHYQTLGTAPNRRLVVSWNQIPFYSCTTTYGTFQIIIYETTNIVETHIQNKPACLQWAGGTATHGLHNLAGTFAYVVPGRNSTQWTTANEGWRFTPGALYQWENTLGQVFPYNGGILNIPSVQSGTVGYFLTYSGTTCAPGIGTPSDTSWVTGINAAVTATGNDDICSSSQGSVTATGTSGIAPYTYNWPALGANTATVNNLPSGTYTVNMTDAIGCTATTSVTIGDIPANYDGDSTEVSCPGGSDGTAFAEMIPVIGNLTYQWDDPAMQTTQTAVGLAAGTYNCVITSDIGCSQTVTVTVTEIPGMIGNIVNQTDVTCNSGNDGMIEVNVTQGTAPYTYSWDNSTSTSNIATDLVVGNHTVTVTDANGCIITITGILGEPAPLNITYLTPNTQICPEAEITLNVSGSGGSTPYIFTWTENGTTIGTGPSMTVDPIDSGTVYCVTLSEQCGSPTDQECMILTFPTPIHPNAIADEYEKCMPGRFEFFNTSSNAGEIATMLFEFGDDEMWLEQGADSTHYEYGAVGVYDLTLTATSIYGCVYVDTLYEFVEVKPNPVADFTFSDNPATIFETTIIAQDRSTPDVIQWSWFSPNSNPTNSAYTKPTFVFPQEVGSYPVTLAVTTEHGCVDTTTIYLHIIQDILFFAPNSFTPDGDEHNQTWKVEVLGIDIYDFDLFIFNRWGEVIWENHDPSVGWDGTYNGKPVQGGQYVWSARVKDLYNDSKEEFSGTINVLK